MALSTQNREAALLRATTDLFVHGGQHNRDEIQRFEELAIHFLPKVLVSDRAYVAESLADRADAPPAVLVLLGKDLVEVAAAILKRAKALSAIDLLSIVAETGALHHRMIATRRNLPPEVERELRQRQDAVTVALLDRPPVTMPLRADNKASVVPFAAPAEEAAESRPYDRDEGDLYADEKSADEPLDFPAPTDELEDAPQPIEIHSAVDRFLELDQEGRNGLLAALAEQRVQPPRLTPRQQFDIALNAAQKAGQIPGLARSKRKEALIGAFADGLALDRGLVERMIDDPSGEPLVLLIKAIGLSDAEARQVLLLANPAIGVAVQTFFRLADLHASMEPAVAEAMVAAWRNNAGAPSEPRHAPYLSDAEGVRQRTRPVERQQPTRRESEFLRRRGGY